MCTSLKGPRRGGRSGGRDVGGVMIGPALPRGLVAPPAHRRKMTAVARRANGGWNMAMMRVAQVPRPKGPFEIVERPIPEPAAGTVRIKVHACGVCHSDSLTKEGGFPGLEYPRVPGHEVAGVIDAVGPGVAGW